MLPTPDGGGSGGGFKGMDTAQVRQMAQKLSQGADHILQLATQLGTAVQSADWKGPDREQFVNAWQSQHMSAIKNVSHALTEAAQKANKNANDQDSTSGS